MTNRIEQRLANTPAIRELLLDMERHAQKRELEQINADPEKHRDTVLMGDRGIRYRYFEIKTGKVSRMRFAWCTVPNAAGYYLTWQEQIKSNGRGHREYIRGHKRRNEAKESALKSFENFKRPLG